MGHPSYTAQRLFTVQEANAMLPLVRAIATDLAQLSRDVIERRQRLAHLLAGRELDQRDPYASELAQIEDEVLKDSERLRGYVEELQELGVEPKNGPDGLIDFPARHDGRIVYLCWKLGEPEVMYWHELDQGFGGRQRLATGRVGDPAARGSPSDEQDEAALEGGSTSTGGHGPH
ncbi:MAG: hypothetical protein A2W31_16875 [Planctomycetes bacterium RBG_16_64_10]|nr:MAG: hypothetical protein A2W31_16875 [Planctomycetes bacterium RBG_16_64_10]